jgi:hypothetical protein
MGAGQGEQSRDAVAGALSKGTEGLLIAADDVTVPLQVLLPLLPQLVQPMELARLKTRLRIGSRL